MIYYWRMTGIGQWIWIYVYGYAADAAGAIANAWAHRNKEELIHI